MCCKGLEGDRLSRNRAHATAMRGPGYNHISSASEPAHHAPGLLGKLPISQTLRVSRKMWLQNGGGHSRSKRSPRAGIKLRFWREAGQTRGAVWRRALDRNPGGIGTPRAPICAICVGQDISSFSTALSRGSVSRPLDAARVPRRLMPRLRRPPPARPAMHMPTTANRTPSHPHATWPLPVPASSANADDAPHELTANS